MNGGQDQPIEQAVEYMAPYFTGSYFTGDRLQFSYSFTPYTAVIDMRTGEVIAKDETGPMSVQDIIAAVESAGD